MSTIADDRLRDELRARGLRVTPQRLVLHRALAARPTHVNAEDLLSQVGDDLPGVSLQTVYSTLELFERLGLVRRVPGARGAATFDSRVDEHHHAVCERCGALVDLDVDAPLGAVLEAARAHGFAEAHAALTVTGTCASCAARRA
jgi:Fe2+ or Zn2+ uptake regulation protein